jgi:hypothetical protein
VPQRAWDNEVESRSQGARRVLRTTELWGRKKTTVREKSK